MRREIIKIDKDKCDGCGACIPNCPEGAIQIIDGKARLISDLFCDGLGACLGHCPQKAIEIETRLTEPYVENAVMENIVKGGDNVILAHLKHLHSHGETRYLNEALHFLRAHLYNNIADTFEAELSNNSGASENKDTGKKPMKLETSLTTSYLTNWPIQLHLVSPSSAYFKEADFLLAADCVGFAYPEFHSDFLVGKSLAIACPKLDTNKQIYLEKLLTMINDASIKSITVLIMQVPCCSGLYTLARNAIDISGKNIPLNLKVISPKGEVLQEFEVN